MCFSKPTTFVAPFGVLGSRVLGGPGPDINTVISTLTKIITSILPPLMKSPANNNKDTDVECPKLA